MNFEPETPFDSNARTNALLHLIMHASSRSPSSNDSPRQGSHQMSLLDASSISNILLLSPSQMRHHRLPMPLKLYAILNSASQQVVSWLPDGQSFQIRNPERFEREILSQYFDYGNMNYLTFVRLLSLWDFKAGTNNSFRHQVSLFLIVTSNENQNDFSDILFLQYLVRGFPELLCSMYLSGAGGGGQDISLKLGNPSRPPLLPIDDFDSMEHTSSPCEMQPKPSLQPRIAFGGSPFSMSAQSRIPPKLPQTSIVFKKQNSIPALTVAGQLSAQKEHPKPPAVSPTSVCVPMSCEDDSTFCRSPAVKKARWLPPLGPASPDERPLFSAQRREDVEYSSWFSTNPELFATLAESTHNH